VRKTVHLASKSVIAIDSALINTALIGGTPNGPRIYKTMLKWKSEKEGQEFEPIFLEYVVGLSKEHFFNILKFVYRTPYAFFFL
jgi:hypothetical protein